MKPRNPPLQSFRLLDQVRGRVRYPDYSFRSNGGVQVLPWRYHWFMIIFEGARRVARVIAVLIVVGFGFESPRV